MRWFETRGPVYPEDNYVVARAEELADFVDRLKKGRYIVLFAPRQTGKTTFFRNALDALERKENGYFPIQLNFEMYVDIDATVFYSSFCNEICKKIKDVYQKRGQNLPEELNRFLVSAQIVDSVSMLEFFETLGGLLEKQRFVMIIDEFDAIPPPALRGFLHTLRQIYLSEKTRCPYSVGIVGVKNIIQLNYDRSISPFNIQDEFKLPNFTLGQVQELLSQYTDEVGQPFAPEVIVSIHKQTAGQPVLVNRFAQMLTEELDIPKSEPITTEHFTKAHVKFLRERNTNIDHLLTNIRRDRRFEALLMKIASYDEGVEFNLDSDIISELATYGVIAEGADGMCEIVNPIYQYRIMRAFKPLVNGLEHEYLPEDNRTGFEDYLTPDGHIQMEALIDNFNDFIARVGFKILQVPETPQEYVGQHLLFAYLSQFVRIVSGTMYLEVQTGRGRMDILILHNHRKYIVETKIWSGDTRYQAGKAQLAAYVRSEKAVEGYYVVFDHRKTPEPRVDTETFEGLTIRSYVIPVLQELPSSVQPQS
ncbi:MAG: AAA-like domain-containing protein [Candidatus Poribacteria bacterium]|nr:AAA-like domain-containing protein [Candidatus Poribacteria bacterium]